MKGLLCVLFALLLCSSMAFAAGEKESAAVKPVALDINEDGTVNNPEAVVVDKDKLVFWSLFSGGDGGFMDEIVSEYNKTNPPKQVQSIMLVWADYYTKLMTAVAAGKGPDIGVSHISKLPELVDQGVVIKIDDYAKRVGTDWNVFTPEMNEGVTFDGGHYAMPLDTHAEIMYFNRDWLRKAGISLNKDDQLSITSTDDFIAILKKLQAVTANGQSALSLTQKGDDPYRVWWATYFQMGGTPLTNEAGDKITMDKGIAVKAASFIKGLYDSGYILSGIEDHQRFFQGGNAGLLFGGTWATGAFEKTENLNFGAQPFPQLFANPSCWADAHTFIIPVKKGRSDADTEAAVHFINYVSSKAAAHWAKSGQIPSDLTVQQSDEYLAMPYRSDYMEAASTAVLPSKNPNFYSMKEAMIRNLDTIWANQVSVEKGIENLALELEEAIL